MGNSCASVKVKSQMKPVSKAIVPIAADELSIEKIVSTEQTKHVSVPLKLKLTADPYHNLSFVDQQGT